MTKVAYLGLPGSFSYIAARQAFSAEDELMGAASFKDIFAQVDSGTAAFGIIPIENSIAGSIDENYDLLASSHLHVVGEQYLEVRHALLVASSALTGKDKKTVLRAIRRAYSHPKALEQCSAFLSRHPNMQISPYQDTASAAKFVAEQGDPTLAAIASPQAAELYGLKIAHAHAENQANNYTRFLIIAKIRLEIPSDAKPL